MEHLNKLTFKTALSTVLLIMIMYLTGCDITDPTDGLRAIFNTKERTSTVSFIFRDAQTNEPIGFEEEVNLQVQFNGSDSGLLIDLFNRPLETGLRPRKGFVSFAIDDDRIPTPDNPVEFTLIANADGYISTSRQVYLSQPGSNAYEVIMVNRDNLPNGVKGGQITNLGRTDATNGTESEIIINSGALGRELPASVRIAEGTLMLDSDGNALSGPIESEIYHFNSRDEESLQSFPGGFSATVSNPDDLQGAEQNVFFTTGGFISLDISVGGRDVRSFSQPIDIEMQIADDAFDELGNPVQPGDTAPIWSYDEQSGEWTFESEVPVGTTKDGQLSLNFRAKHLSWWNIDWYGDSCSYGTIVNFLNINQQVRGKLYRTDVDPNTFLGWNPSRTISGEPNSIQFYLAPEDIPGRLEIYNMADEFMAEVDLPDLCSSTPVEVDLDPQELTISFRGRGLCPNDDGLELRPNVPVFYKPASGGTWLQAGNAVDGEIDVTFPQPGVYMVGTYFEDEWYEYELDLSDFEDGDVYEQEIELPQNICDDL